MIIIFYKYVDGVFVENDGWHKYDRRLVLDRIGRQNEHVRYKALIRESFPDECETWHRLDLSKSKKFKKQPRQLNLF